MSAAAALLALALVQAPPERRPELPWALRLDGPGPAAETVPLAPAARLPRPGHLLALEVLAGGATLLASDVAVAVTWEQVFSGGLVGPGAPTGRAAVGTGAMALAALELNPLLSALAERAVDRFHDDTTAQLTPTWLAGLGMGLLTAAATFGAAQFETGDFAVLSPSTFMLLRWVATPIVQVEVMDAWREGPGALR